MMRPLNIRDSKTEVQPCKSYSSDFHGEEASVATVESYVDAFEDIYTSPTFTNASNFDTSLSNGTWASEARAGLDSQLAGPIHSPPIPTHCISIPFTTSYNGVDPMAFNGWQFDTYSFMQMNVELPWWCGNWANSESGDQTIRSSRILKTGTSIADNQIPETIPLSDDKTDGSEHGNRTDSLHPSPSCRKKKSDGLGSCQETGINSNTSALTVALMNSSDPATSPMPLTPDISFDPPDTEAQTKPRRSSSSKRRTRQSTPATLRPGQRARNRIAANKCRIKTKAAMAELEATEKEESSRHEQLSMTLKSLQADVFALKSEVLLHGTCGDRLIQDYLNKSAMSLAAGCGGAGECGPGTGSPVSNSGSIQLRR